MRAGQRPLEPLAPPPGPEESNFRKFLDVVGFLAYLLVAPVMAAALYAAELLAELLGL